MRNLRITSAGLAVMMAMSAGSSAVAQSSGAPEATAEAAKPELPASSPPARASSFVPADFHAPTSATGAGFKIVPLGPELVKVDFDAYMSSIEHLQKTFSRSTSWPHKGISDADAMRDMENESARFKNRQSFAYAVLTSDGSRERGSVYVSPSPIQGYDAVVRLWVTKAEYDDGFDAELYKWVTGWIRTDWPFQKVAYPGRSIDWETWDAMVAAEKAASKEKTP